MMRHIPSKTIGAIVTDYSGKSAGDYEDEITYKAEVATVLLSLTVTDPEGTGAGSITFYYAEGEKWGEAISNHPAENSGWGSNVGSVYYGNWYYIRLSSNHNNVNVNNVINSTASYVFME